MAKSRRGRKRKNVRRQPNGQPYRPPEINPLELAKTWPHRRANADAISDHRGECELGRLSLDGVITMEQYQAGVKFRQVVGNMRRAIDAPSPNAKSAAAVLVASGGSIVAHLDHLAPELAKELADKARREYRDALRALMAGGRDSFLAVKLVAIEDMDREYVGSIDLRNGLTLLARHFGLTGRR